MITNNATALALRRALRRKLQPNFVDRHGWTDLHYAAMLNLPGLVNALLWRGAEMSARLPDNAAAAEDVTALLGGFGVDFSMCSGEMPLHLACITNAALAAHALVKNGADVHATLPTVSNWTPLHVAARFNAADAAFVLLLRGADVEYRDELDAPPLHMAALYNAVDTVETLLAAGASVRAKAKDDLTALHLAAQADSPGVAARLLDHGADVNALSAAEGTSPLDHAIVKSARSTADLLRRRGGHPTVESRLDMKTVLETKVGDQDVLVPVFEHNWVRRPKPHRLTSVFSHPLSVHFLMAGFLAEERPPGWLDRFDLDDVALVPVDWVPLEWRCADVMWSIPLRAGVASATAEGSDGKSVATHLLLVVKFADTVIEDVSERLGHHFNMLMHELDRRGLYGAPDHPPMVENIVVNSGKTTWPHDAPSMDRVPS